jgi:hypothetical protein
MDTVNNPALEAMAEKIKHLERQNHALREELRAVEQCTFEARLGKLRLYGITLVWASRDYSRERKEWTASTLEAEFGSELWRHCVRHMFDLHAIVKSPAVEQQVANAFENGKGKFDAS